MEYEPLLGHLHPSLGRCQRSWFMLDFCSSLPYQGATILRGEYYHRPPSHLQSSISRARTSLCCSGPQLPGRSRYLPPTEPASAAILYNISCHCFSAPAELRPWPGTARSLSGVLQIPGEKLFGAHASPRNRKTRSDYYYSLSRFFIIFQAFVFFTSLVSRLAVDFPIHSR